VCGNFKLVHAWSKAAFWMASSDRLESFNGLKSSSIFAAFTTVLNFSAEDCKVRKRVQTVVLLAAITPHGDYDLLIDLFLDLGRYSHAEKIKLWKEDVPKKLAAEPTPFEMIETPISSALA
jgi:hypothetical protein